MAFTGKAVYDNYANEVQIEMAKQVSMIVGLGATPILDYLGTPNMPVISPVYEWVESGYPQRTFVNTTAIASSAAASYVIGITGGAANSRQLRPGMRLQASTNGEIMKVTSITANSIYVARAQDGTTANSAAAGITLYLTGALVEEGQSAQIGTDLNLDISRRRTRVTNYTSIIMRPLLLSGSERNTAQWGNWDQMADELTNQMRASLVDLEMQIIRQTNVATIGASGTDRTMKGARQLLSTNIQSFGATFTQSFLENNIKVCWSNGGMPNTIFLGDQYKRQIDSFITSNRRYTESSRRVADLVSVYESNYGIMNAIMCRWLNTDELIITDSTKWAVPNLQGRSFFVTPVRQNGDVYQQEIIGEYGLELKNESLHLRSALASVDIATATNPAVAAA
jgi:hypothetical protein